MARRAGDQAADRRGLAGGGGLRPVRRHGRLRPRLRRRRVRLPRRRVRAARPPRRRPGPGHRRDDDRGRPGCRMALDAAYLGCARPLPLVRFRPAGRHPSRYLERPANGGKPAGPGAVTAGPLTGPASPARTAAAPARARPAGRGLRRRRALPLVPGTAGRGPGSPVRRDRDRGPGRRPGGAVRRGPDGRRRGDRLDPVLRPRLLAVARRPPAQRTRHVRDRLHLARPGRDQDRREHRDEAPHAHVRLRGLAGALGVPAHRRAEPALTRRHAANRRALRGHPARAPARRRPEPEGLRPVQHHRGRMALGQTAS